MAEKEKRVVYDFHGELPKKPGVEYVDGSDEFLSDEDKITDEDRNGPLAGLFAGKLGKHKRADGEK